MALADPEVLAQPAVTERLTAAFEQVRSGAAATSDPGPALADDEEMAQLFQAWREEQRSGLARRLFGGGAGRPAPAAGTGQGEA